jgi:hypothetical protein
MSINSIIDYINNNKTIENSYFKGDINEYLNNGTIYMNIIQSKFPDYYECSNNSIVLFHNDNWILIEFNVTSNYKDIFWIISMSKNREDLYKSRFIPVLI